MNILMILTSHAQLGDSGAQTGYWLEEFAAPFYVFMDAGAKLTLASPRGGQPPVDPKSEEPAAQTEATHRLRADAAAMEQVAHTLKLGDLQAEAFDAVFFPGGHGPLWDLANDQQCIAVIQSIWAASKPVVAVCHAPAVLRDVKVPGGSSIVKGRRVTGYSNTEEDAVGLSKVVPFLVEDMLKERGGAYTKVADWQPHVVTDGLLITGQNPASSKPAALALLKLLSERRPR